MKTIIQSLISKFYEVIIIFLIIMIFIISSVLVIQTIRFNNASSNLHDSEKNCELKVLKQKEAYSDAFAKAQEKANEKSIDLERQLTTLKVKQNVITIEVEKIIDRPIYRNVCLDTDGMHQINAAIKAYDSSKFNDGMSTTSTN